MRCGGGSARISVFPIQETCHDCAACLHRSFSLASRERGAGHRGTTNPGSISSYYPKEPASPTDDKAQAVDAATPVWKDIRIDNVTITGSQNALLIWGLPEMPISGVTLTNVKISAENGMKVFNARDIVFSGCAIQVRKGPPLTVYDAQVRGVKTTPLLPEARHRQ